MTFACIDTVPFSRSTTSQLSHDLAHTPAGSDAEPDDVGQVEAAQLVVGSDLRVLGAPIALVLGTAWVGHIMWDSSVGYGLRAADGTMRSARFRAEQA